MAILELLGHTRFNLLLMLLALCTQDACGQHRKARTGSHGWH
jgi:hypothetical protein